MPVFAISAALGASFCWAAGGLLAHGPARALGAFEFTRIQLVACSALLALVVTLTGGWVSVDWVTWPFAALSALFGVLLGNLAMIACLRRGGPRRMELLMAANPPFAALMGYWFLGETLTLSVALGGAVTLAGVVLAIRHGSPATTRDPYEQVEGSLSGVILLGLAAAFCQAVGLIAIKPVMSAGADPLTASLLRTGAAALMITLIALWPARAFLAGAPLTPPLLVRTLIPGIMGYVLAVTLLLYALDNYHVGVVAVLGSTAPVMLLPLLWARTGSRPPWPAWAGAALVVTGSALLINS